MPSQGSLTNRKTEPHSGSAVRLRFNTGTRSNARPRVCRVGLSTAEVTARPLSSLTGCQRPARLRSQDSVNGSGVVPLLLQRELHVFDDPIRHPVRIAGANRSVVRISHIRVVAPGPDTNSQRSCLYSLILPRVRVRHCGVLDHTCCWRTASNNTIATAVARFRLRVPCIGIVMQLGALAASNFPGSPFVSRPNTRKSSFRKFTL
jgi:hypothetical protein